MSANGHNRISDRTPQAVSVDQLLQAIGELEVSRRISLQTIAAKDAEIAELRAFVQRLQMEITDSAGSVAQP